MHDDPAGLLQRVPPQGRRVGQEPGPGPVDDDPVLRAVGVALAVARDHGQLVVVGDDQPRSVAAGDEPVDVVLQAGDSMAAQVKALKAGPRRGVAEPGAALPEVARDRVQQPGQPALDGLQRGVPRLGHRQGHDPLADALEVHGDRPRPLTARPAVRPSGGRACGRVAPSARAWRSRARSPGGRGGRRRAAAVAPDATAAAGAGPGRSRAGPAFSPPAGFRAESSAPVSSALASSDSASSASSESGSSAAGRPPGWGPNGDSVAAASGTR